MRKMFFKLAWKDIRKKWQRVVFVHLSIFLLIFIFSYLSFFTEHVRDVLDLIDRPLTGDHVSFRVYPKKKKTFNYMTFYKFYQEYLEVGKAYSSAVEEQQGVNTNYVVGFGNFSAIFLPELNFSEFTEDEIPVVVGKNVHDCPEIFEHPFYGKCRVAYVLDEHRNFIHYQSLMSFDNYVTLLPQKGQIFRSEKNLIEYQFSLRLLESFFNALYLSDQGDLEESFELLSKIGLYEFVPITREENIKYVNYGHLRSLLLYIITYSVSFFFLLFSFHRLITDSIEERRCDYMIHFLSGARKKDILKRIMAYIGLLTMPPVLFLLILRFFAEKDDFDLMLFFDVRAIVTVSLITFCISIGSAVVRLNQLNQSIGKEGYQIGKR